MSPALICPNMKKTSLESVYKALRDNEYEIHLPMILLQRPEMSG